jgi:2-desacetyl-2-hydroxyethyl bacteriochlorophyllide A dehydrogenase
MMTQHSDQAIVAAYDAQGRLVLEERALPALQDGEVRLAVDACGICGSDLHAYDAGWLAVGEVPGHETAGTVVECGSGVTDAAVGDRIAIHPLIPCRECDFCVAGLDNVCSRMRNARGGFSSQMILPAGTRKFRIPESIDITIGAMLEPLGVAVRAANLAPVSADTPCLVTGLGAIGQCVVRVLRARGVRQVVAVDVVKPKLELARTVGAVGLNAEEVDVARELTERFGGGTHKGYEYANVPVAIDCSGAPSVIANSVRSYLMPSGTLVVAALFEHELTFDLNPLVRKEINLKGSYSANEEALEQAYALLTSGAVRLDDLLGDMFSLEHIDEVFRDPSTRAGAVKVVVVPGGGTPKVTFGP